MAVACVHVRSWQVAYRNLLPDAYLDGLRSEDRAKVYDFSHSDPTRPWTLLAMEGDVILGFATVCAGRDPDLPDHGELGALYVDPEHWKQGTGSSLITAARAHLVELGYRRAFLWVLAGNTRAERFYAQDGWAPDGYRRSATVWGVTVEELRYRRNL